MDLRISVAEILAWLALILLVGFLVWLFMIGGALSIAGPQCLSRGYPHYEVTWYLKAYCIREIDETEYVVPLNELRQQNSEVKE